MFAIDSYRDNNELFIYLVPKNRQPISGTKYGEIDRAKVVIINYKCKKSI